VLEVSILARKAVRQRARRRAAAGRTTKDYSRRMAALTGLQRPSFPLRNGLAALAVVGAALLAATPFLAVIEIAVGGTSRLAEADTRVEGWERHGPALLVLGAFAALLAVGAARGARPAMAALGACGLAALGLVVVVDLPDLDETGLIGVLYAEAEAGPGAGWYTEIAGAALLVLAAAGLLLAELRGRAGITAAARGDGAAAPAPRTSLARVRAHCLSLPETSERLSHGAPTFFIRQKRAFVTFHENHHGDGRVALWCAAPEGVQAGLVDAAPERYFVPPYVGSRGWIGVRLDRDVPWDEIAGVIEDAYVARAPKTLVATVKGANSGG
jgi:hypothetical protein